jgi:chromosome segregation ATPase
MGGRVLSGDRSADERFALTERIAAVERREDEVAALRNEYQRSLERFHDEFRSVARRRESSLHESMQTGNSAAQRELEAHQQLLFQVDRYVEDAAAELSWTSSRVRQTLDDEREALIRERSELPWE